MTDSITESKKCNGFLDIIKTIAAILIIFHHFQQDLDVRFSFINFWDGSFYFHAFCFHIPIKEMLVILFKSDTIREIVISNGLLSMMIYVVIVYGFSIMTCFSIKKPLSGKSSVITAKG